jgi:hypothetical protein
VTYVPFNVWPAPAGEGGATVHSQLTGRSAANGHPISAITGLQDALDAIAGGAGMWEVDVALVGITVEALVGIVGWETFASGRLVDSSGTVKVLDADAETITALDPAPPAGDVLIVRDFQNFADDVYGQRGGLIFVDELGVADIADPAAWSFRFTLQPVDVTLDGTLYNGTLTSLPDLSDLNAALLAVDSFDVDDLGYSVADDLTAPVSALIGETYTVDPALDDSLSEFLQWLAVRDWNLTGATAALGVQAVVLGSTIGAEGVQQDLDGAGATYTIGVAQAGSWHNVYVDNPCDIVLGDTPDDSATSWPDGTKLYFWHGNTEQANFIAGGDAIVRSPAGTDPALAAEYGVVTAVWRLPTQEWMLYGDLYAPPTPQRWAFGEPEADFDADGVLTDGYVHYLVTTTSGDVDARLPDAGATVGLPIRIQKFSGDSNDVLITDEAGTSTYYTLTTASTVEVVWTGSTYIFLPY